MEFIFNSIGLKPEHQQLLVRSAWVVFVTFHILWVCGWLTILGLAPPFAPAAEYAKAADFKQIDMELRQDRLERIEHDILTVKTSYCKANNDEAKRQYAQRVQELIDRYYKLASNNPRVPTCDEV